MKIVIPMAGWGTRMRPHTWSKPKPLISVGGKTSLDHLMDMFASLPDPANAEFIFIVGPYLGEIQIPAYISKHYPELKAHYIVQSEMKGQSHALYLARKHLTGPMVMCFSDTLIETDFSFLAQETADGVAWVKPVPDPRRFGVAEIDPDGWVTRLIEKPQEMDKNLAVVGCYYFKNGEALVAAIEEQITRNVQLKNEYFLADAINILLENGARIRIEEVETWLDTGTIDATLETNRYLLAHGHENSSEHAGTDIEIIPPVFIHPTAVVSSSVIGPNVSIGPNCRVSNSRIEESVLEDGVQVIASNLTESFIGRNVMIQGCGGVSTPAKLNIGDDSSIKHI